MARGINPRLSGRPPAMPLPGTGVVRVVRRGYGRTAGPGGGAAATRRHADHRGPGRENVLRSAPAAAAGCAGGGDRPLRRASNTQAAGTGIAVATIFGAQAGFLSRR